MPRLSVIVCTYNRASFLPGCLASLRASGVSPSDLEIVVVDDGSTDDTKSAIVQLGGPDIRYIYQSNQGLSTARNTGIRASTGTYIAYLDSDDLWLPGVAPKMLAFLDTHTEVGIAFANAKVGNDIEGFSAWDEWAGREEFKQLAHTPRDGFRIFERAAFHRLLIRRNLVFTGAVFQRRELLIAAGLFQPKLNAAGDWELYLRLAASHVFAYLPEMLAIYLQHPSQMTMGVDRMANEFCETRRSHLASVPNLGVEEKRLLRKALCEEQFYYAYLAYDRKDYREAHLRYGQLLRESGFHAKAALYWAVTALPNWTVQGIRSMCKPFVRNDGLRVGPQPWAPEARAIHKEALRKG